MGFLATIGNAIWANLEPSLNARLDVIEKLAKDELTAWRTDSMAMLTEALPEMAGAVAEQAVKTVFDHTQVDEAADDVASAIRGIVARLGDIPFLGGLRP